MEFWKKIFKGEGKAREQPSKIDSITISDWLHNMSDGFLECGAETTKNNPASPAMLAYFTLFNSSASSLNLLHLMPDIRDRIGDAFKEFRLYYDCVWQNILLEKYSKESEKVSNLYALVDIKLVGILKSLFEQNPNIKKLLIGAIEKDYYGHLMTAVKIYIHGEYSEIEKPNSFNDLLEKNVDALALRLGYAYGKRNDHKFVEAMVRQLREDLDRALRIVFLTRFDFNNCNVIQFPDDFLQK